MNDEDDGFFILVLGVLAAIVAVVCWWFLRDHSIDTAIEVDSTEVIVVDEEFPVDEDHAADDEDHEAEAVADLTAAALTGEIDGNGILVVTGVVPDEETTATLEVNAVNQFGADNVIFVLTIDDTTTNEGGVFTISGEVENDQVAPTIFEGLFVGLSGYTLVDNTTVAEAEVATGTGAVLIAVGADAIDVDGTVPDGATSDQVLTYVEVGSLGRQMNDNLVIDETVATVTELELRGEAVNSAEKFALSEGLAELAASLGVSEPVDSLTVAARPALENELNALVAAEPIQFDTGSATIRSESIPTLDKIVALLQPTGGVAPPPLEVQGHTDNTGDPIANVNLSLDRAVAVVNYLDQKGVNVDQISPVGFGANRPIASNDTDQGRQQNRRIEFAIVG